MCFFRNRNGLFVLTSLLVQDAALEESLPCICYSRNNVVNQQQLRRVTLSALSARRAVHARICLITDNENVEIPRNVFEIVHFINETWSPLVSALAATNYSQSRIARSRLSRLHYLAQPPCAKTLFVDDDTYWCPDNNKLNLEPLFYHPDISVRGFIFYKTKKEHAVNTAARECIAESLKPTPETAINCYDNAQASIPQNSCAGAQGGAIAIRRSTTASAFVKDWIKEYSNRDLDAVRRDPRKMDWYDQGALSRLSHKRCNGKISSSWTIGNLPYLLNYRAVKKYAFKGRVHLLHQKALMPSSNLSFHDQKQHLNAVCDTLNAAPHEMRVLTIYDSPLASYVTTSNKPQRPQRLRRPQNARKQQRYKEQDTSIFLGQQQGNKRTTSNTEKRSKNMKENIVRRRSAHNGDYKKKYKKGGKCMHGEVSPIMTNVKYGASCTVELQVFLLSARLLLSL